jgi:hypothetical protein
MLFYSNTPTLSTEGIRREGLKRRIYNTERRLYNFSKLKVFTAEIIEFIRQDRQALEEMKQELTQYN